MPLPVAPVIVASPSAACQVKAPAPPMVWLLIAAFAAAAGVGASRPSGAVFRSTGPVTVTVSALW
ncbi:MAG: hypothetical protein IPP68_12400 [Elusimicrobia bacterium]|nr:hypothetical protein [Elusimicrobiota bacterium]